ncbi:archaeosine synthase subunit alpha [Halapricum hydrolyticum]|uniref:Archaeosine synthase subunit alpha n=1 Tax=Halapricum hydrolyticum TaxID=2979991 RepID=A0AAE3IAH0_9EURY|nr:archaeosine synthase subunit alpha [Halapricum hydrolyticum]MCU4717794.1 archaeosine synthase subunit alpha [Halapricum hydrolyticum]MCU4726958.1 archaeosine synthase subunit alpha [Halapricum hydrolyticum]
MTEYFEVHHRDGAARVGELRLSDPVRTPAIADDVTADAGSEWPEGRELPGGSEDEVTILPHRGFPSGTPEEVQEAFAPDYPEVEYPSGVVVSRETAADFGADVYVLSGAQGIVDHAEAFVETIVDVRESIPADSALYLPGVATPANVATLVYAGADLVDTDRAVIKGTQGKYLTSDGEVFLEDLEELPCSCPACQQPADSADREDCIEHNVNALRTELARVRERIRSGRLRDYIEGQARHDQWLTATFRRLDQQYAYLEQRTPLVRGAEITAASDDTLRRVEIQRFAERVTTRYRNRFDAPLVLVPCSARKPYSESRSHGRFHDAIQFRGHTVSMTSPIGVVPQELELTYPAQHYDSVVTGRWSATEIEFVADVLAAYLERNEYPRYIAHLPEDYLPIVERVEDRLGIDFEYTVAEHPTDTESLANLSSTLAGEPKYRKRERQHNTLKAIADYQFGEGAGDELFDDLRIESRYPKLRAHDADGEQLAALVPNYGTLSLTLAGAKRWLDSDVPTKRAEIDAFVPRGSVLAPGIVDADDDIRPGDEVVFEGPKAISIGRAEMSGPEMVGSTRGIASEVRHTEEK